MTRKPNKNKETPAETSEEINSPSEGKPQIPDAPSHEDELLAEARRALIEEQDQEPLNNGMLQKMTGRLRATGLLNPKKVPPPPEKPEAEEIELDKRLEETLNLESLPALEPAALDEETQSLLDALDNSGPPAASDVAAALDAGHPPIEPAPARIEDGSDYRDMRNAALEDYEEPKVETVSARPTLNQQMGRLTDRIPYQTLIRITIISLTAVVCLGILLAAILVLKIGPAAATPPPTNTAAATLSAPVPIQVRLTGGWMFTLARGEVTGGKWSPAKPEWLDGTEICRWVSLPWSTQLEAVFRSFKTGDRIDLVMSNYDHWTYRVKSVQEKRVFEIPELDKNYPSLLLILTNPDSDTRLVVLAVP